MKADQQFQTRGRLPAISSLQTAEVQSKGPGFSALSFTHRQVDGLMDPLIMVDHFVMTEPTFGPHAHAGLSAISVLFEDSIGAFRNRDSLGNDVLLAPGDLYWLKAARGAVHDEFPAPGSRTHALQIFLNLPADRKLEAPASLHVPAGQMPEIEGVDHRVRVVLGESNGVQGASSPALPFTILDVALKAGGSFTHRPGPDSAAWIHVVDGEIDVSFDGEQHVLRDHLALATHGACELRLESARGGQAVILSGAPLREPFVQKGPFAMRDADQLAAVIAAHQAGELGSLD